MFPLMSFPLYIKITLCPLRSILSRKFSHLSWHDMFTLTYARDQIIEKEKKKCGCLRAAFLYFQPSKLKSWLMHSLFLNAVSVKATRTMFPPPASLVSWVFLIYMAQTILINYLLTSKSEKLQNIALLKGKTPYNIYSYT